MILLYHTVNMEESLIPSEVGDVIMKSMGITLGACKL